MENASTSARRMLKSRSLVFLVVVLLVLAVLAMTTGTPASDEAPALKAVASATPSTAMVGGDVSFSAAGSRGDIATYQWDMGDGTVLDGSEVVHAFELGGWHNVTLTVFTEGGRSANATVPVGVQPEDVHAVRELGRDRDVRPMWGHGPGLLGTIGPHIGPPTAELRYHVVRAFGTFDVNVEVWVRSGDGYETERLYGESLTMTGSDLDFTYTVSPDDLPDAAATNESMVHMYAIIDQGRWGGGEITVDVEFPIPIEDIAEPR
jgi:hypothetical protein